MVGTTGAWRTDGDRASSNSANFFDSTSNEMYMTGLQIEVGNTMTSYEHRTYGEELIRCQRYYNKVYDVLDKMGVGKNEQRVCVPFGEEPMRGLWQYKVGWPDLWAKMTSRVPGASTAEKYSRTQ